MRGPVVQSLNVRQISLRASGRPASTSAGSSGYESTMRPRPTKSVSPRRTVYCADVRQPLLQVGVARADDRHVRGTRAFSRAVDVDLPRHAAQRILGRLVAVARRKQRRPLDVRAVVRAAGGHAHPADVARLAAAAGARGCPRARRRGARRRAGRTRADSRRRRLPARRRPSGALAIRHGVEHRQPHADAEAGTRRRGCRRRCRAGSGCGSRSCRRTRPVASRALEQLVPESSRGSA